MGIITEENYLVHYYDVDYCKKLSISSMVNYFQDIALIQSEKIGKGVEYYHDNNIMWVLYKWKIYIKSLPEMFQSVKVRTWPYHFRKTTGWRRFEIEDENGEIIISADSIWFLINEQTHKPIKIPEDIIHSYAVNSERADQSHFEKLHVPENPVYTFNGIVHNTDIDTNNHVNNVRYIQWSLSNIDKEWREQHFLKELDVHYINECFLNNKIKVGHEIVSDGKFQIINHIVEKANGEKLALLRSKWT